MEDAVSSRKIPMASFGSKKELQVFPKSLRFVVQELIGFLFNDDADNQRVVG